MTDDIVARLREDAEDHKDVAGCCDCDPKDTRNWQHALNNEEAADEIERLRAALQKYADEEYNGYNACGGHAHAALEGEKKDD